jgi:hypothetical protein
MINQVDFEGYLTRAWEYREQRFMRLANHRPGDEGQTSSDYITVLIDSALDFDPRRVKVGRLLRVHGRIVGRDIVEPLKLVVSKSHNSVELPGELNNLIIRRPTIQIFATQVKVDWKDQKALQKKKSKGPIQGKLIPTPLPDAPIELGQDLAELVPAK